MKTQINPVVAGIVIAIIVVLIGGVFLMKQRGQSSPDYSMVGPDGQRHAPGAGGGGGASASASPMSGGASAAKPTAGAAAQ